MPNQYVQRETGKPESTLRTPCWTAAKKKKTCKKTCNEKA